MRCNLAVSLVLIGIAMSWSAPALSQVHKGKPSGTKPVIERFEPTSGLPGIQVSIYGTNFSSGYSVWLGTTKLKVVAVVSNKITVKIPKNAKSGHFVLKGKHIVESSGTFGVLEPKDPPTISGFDPTTGAPGTKVTIKGSNFSVQTFENTVMLGNSPVTVMSASPTQLKVVIPKGSVTGKFTVNVLNAGSVQSGKTFTIVEAFAVDSFAPKVGGPGSKVNLVGSGFGTSTKNIKVTLAGLSCKVLSVDPHNIQIQLPSNAIGGTFSISQKGEGTIKATGVFTVVIPPVIEKFSPAGGFPGTVVTINGKHFGTNSINLRVKLGSQIIKILSFTDTRIEAQVPKDAKSGKLTVEVTGKGGDTSDADFDVWVPVKFFAFSPTKGEVGATIVIKGQGFGTDLKNVDVTLAGNPLKILALTSSQIQVQVPDKAVTGFLQVTVKDRGAPVSSTAEFKVIYPPEIGKFKPAAGQPGTLLTVEGKNFGMLIDSIRVLVGPDKKQQFCIVSKLTDSKLTCQVQPSTLTGPVTVKVKGMGEALTQKTFEVWTPVTVTSFTPKDGLPGTLVTIKGGGFVTKKGATSVKVGGKNVKTKSITTDTIVIQIPDKGVAGGSFEVNVKGRGTAVSPGTFKVILPTKITNVKPTKGPVGTVVSIKGQGFGDNVNQIAVTFMGFYCTVTSVTPSEIEVIVPDGLTEGISGKFQIIVTTGGIAEAPKAFKVTKPKHPKVKAKPK
jgi:uncharacterized protein (TIGR03437 family)